jgi:hypothetical protein
MSYKTDAARLRKSVGILKSKLEWARNEIRETRRLLREVYQAWNKDSWDQGPTLNETIGEVGTYLAQVESGARQ